MSAPSADEGSGRRPSRFRIRYYDLFSRVYDRFVAAHSNDREGRLREALAERTALRPGGRALDLCTGTGAMLGALRRRTGEAGLVVGLDFSRGMLVEARRKTVAEAGVALVEADAEHLPFRDGAFDAVTCSHAFYELKGDGAERTLEEVARAPKAEGRFLVMEHEVPDGLPLRILFYIRLLSMGLRKALEILGNEEALFHRRFEAVERVATGSGGSKIIAGSRPRPAGFPSRRRGSTERDPRPAGRER